MKDLKFICAQPDDTYYTWQVHMWLESLRERGLSDRAIVLIFIPSFREENTKWKQIVDLYPEAEFAFYKDVDGISQFLGTYIPILRPYVLMKYFKEHPEMEQKAVFYCDSDTVLTDKFNVDAYINDDINYLSDTNSYINARYFDSKVHQVLPEKLDEYKQRDILEELATRCGISRAIAEEHNDHSGGAQYLLKNIDYKFWEKVMQDCLIIRTYLQEINRQFFKDENTGFQSWCADMWAVLWNIWYRGNEAKNVPEMDFSWSSDPIQKVESTGIFHNAGIVSDTANGYPAFYKGKYHHGANPFLDPHLQTVLTNEISQKHGTYYYTNRLMNLYKKYNLNY